MEFEQAIRQWVQTYPERVTGGIEQSDRFRRAIHDLVKDIVAEPRRTPGERREYREVWCDETGSVPYDGWTVQHIVEEEGEMLRVEAGHPDVAGGLVVGFHLSTEVVEWVDEDSVRQLMATEE